MIEGLQDGDESIDNMRERERERERERRVRYLENPKE